jgi:serine/threonine protein kinase/DNA-binding LacI/PurR family transcriptional regulator
MPKDPLLGQSLKEFHLIERIGRGGMATVYRAHQPSVNRDVAVKVIQLDDEDRGSDFQQRFAQEASVIARLEHIHILPVYDYGLEGDVAFLAMRLLRGGSLQDLVREGPIPLDKTVDLFKQIASALSYAHHHGVIHRDLKPSNMLLDNSGNVYVTDFGLAKIIGDSLEISQKDRIVGTPHYIAPEQVRGEAATPRSDIYSMGIVLYRMLVGRLPFEGSSSDLVSLIYQNLEKAPPSPRELNADIPVSVEEVVLRALAKDPDQRFESVEAMSKALETAVGRFSTDSYPVLAAPQTLDLERPRVSTRLRNRLLVAGLALVLLAVLLGVWVSRDDKSPTEKLPDAQVLSGASLMAGDLRPTTTEIATAQRVLSDEGFIAFMACNQSSEYHATLGREMADFAREYDLPFRIYDSDSDAYQQVTEIEKARSDGALGMIVCSLDNALLDTPIRSAERTGIRMVFLSGEMTGYEGVLVAGDNYLLGEKPGHYAGTVIRDERAGEANVILLGFPDLDSIVARADGMKEGLLEFAPNVEIVGEYLGGTQDNARESVSKALEDGVEFDVILSINDAGSYGAIEALEAAGVRPDEVMIFSVDAEQLARRYIREGRFMRASVAVGRTISAQASIDAMVKLLAGAPIPQQIYTEPGELVTWESLSVQP